MSVIKYKCTNFFTMFAIFYYFRFKAGGLWYTVQVKVIDFVEVFMGWEWEARILERSSYNHRN